MLLNDNGSLGKPVGAPSQDPPGKNVKRVIIMTIFFIYFIFFHYYENDTLHGSENVTIVYQSENSEHDLRPERDAPVQLPMTF